MVFNARFYLSMVLVQPTRTIVITVAFGCIVYRGKVVLAPLFFIIIKLLIIKI